MLGGWVKIHRKIMLSPEWVEGSAVQKVIMLTILLKANHKAATVETKGGPVKLKPGQLITSVRSLQKAAGKGVSLQNVRTVLKRLKLTHYLTQQVTQHYSLITVCKWGSYQGLESEHNTQTNTQPNNEQEVKEIKEKSKGIKKPLSMLLAQVMITKSPNLYIDKEQDYKRLTIVSHKLKTLIKAKKASQGIPYNSANNAEIVEGFKFLVNSLSPWELKNRFYPEWILTNFSSIVNKAKKTATDAPAKLSLGAFNKIR
jgi:DNA replication protein DnaD